MNIPTIGEIWKSPNSLEWVVFADPFGQRLMATDCGRYITNVDMVDFSEWIRVKGVLDFYSEVLGVPWRPGAEEVRCACGAKMYLVGKNLRTLGQVYRCPHCHPNGEIIWDT